MLSKLKQRVSRNGQTEQNGQTPDRIPDDATAVVTPVSASSVRRLARGAEVSEWYSKVLYIPRGGWPGSPAPGLLDELMTHSSAGVQVKVRADPMDRERAAAEFKRRVSDKKRSCMRSSRRTRRIPL